MRHSVACAVLFLLSAPVSALEPNEVFLLVNKNVAASKDVAEHYCLKRGVPAENIVVLDLPTGEDISRSDYNEKISAPLRTALKDKKAQAKVLLSTFGVPLRVGPQVSTEKELALLQQLEPGFKEKQDELDVLQLQVNMLESIYRSNPSEKLAKWLEETKRSRAQKQAETGRILQQRLALSHAESQACVDSELMLLWWDSYELARWQVNLLYWRIPQRARDSSPRTMMTCRLDGPSVQVVKRLIDQAVEVEQKGLEGKVYVDARGIRYDPKIDEPTQYAGYDESMREMAALLEKQGKMTVILDNEESLFKPGACPNCALYCGWYSLANFVDSFAFAPGAVAWHLASLEAVSLRDPKAKTWCKNLLENGAAATLGPVAEPYTIGFPKPAEFFGFLATGKYTLVECYSRTLLLNSWMTVLVGDPLYNPFSKNPRLKEEEVEPSPKGSKPIFIRN